MTTPTPTKYLDFDSSYRDRNMYPNPCSFVVKYNPNQCNNIFQNTNPITLELPLFPVQLTSTFIYPEFFPEFQMSYLPYMYNTTIDGSDNVLFYLDSLREEDYAIAIAASQVTIVFENFILNPLEITLDNSFYDSLYLEDVLSGQFEKMVALVPASNVPGSVPPISVAYQYLQKASVDIVLPAFSDLYPYAIRPGQAFTAVGTENPLSNVYDLYKGKNVVFLTGANAGISRPIQLYIMGPLCINPPFPGGPYANNLFLTMQPFPQTIEHGDIFEITATSQWIAQITSPFSNVIPEYPAYNQILPTPTPPYTTTPARPYRIRQQIPFINGLTNYVIGGTTNSVTIPIINANMNRSLVGYFLWIRNAYNPVNYTPITYPFNIFNDVRIITSYEIQANNTAIATVNKPFSSDVGLYIGLFNIQWEILSWGGDGYHPLQITNDNITTYQTVCYEIKLNSISIPNKYFGGNPGNLPAFYDFFYVRLIALNSSQRVVNILNSNNPAAVDILFKVPVDNINNPAEAAFVLLRPQMTQTIKIDNIDSWSFEVLRNNGDVIQYYETDYIPPLPPNPNIQINATFELKRVGGKDAGSNTVSGIMGMPMKK